MMGLRPASSRPEAALALSRKKSAQSYITMLTLASLILFYSLSISAVSIGSVPNIRDIASVLGGSDRLKVIDPGSEDPIRSRRAKSLPGRRRGGPAQGLSHTGRGRGSG